MYSLIYMERTISCETAREIVDLVEETTNRQVSTMLTKEASDKEFAKAFKKPTPRASAAGKRKKVTAAAKKARAAKARASYQKKKAAQQRYLTKKAAEDAVKAPLDLTPPAPPALAEPTTTAEKHHGQKEKRADTGGDIISALRRSGLPLTIPEIRDDLQRSGWKYNGPDPKGTIRATLNRLVTKGEVAKGSSNGALTFRIARVEHADPLPHQQRESDV
jgi:hypothetical protein